MGARLLQCLTFLILSLMIVDTFLKTLSIFFLSLGYNEFWNLHMKGRNACVHNGVKQGALSLQNAYICKYVWGGDLQLSRMCGKHVSWDTGTSFTASCLEDLYRHVAKLQLLLKASHLPCFLFKSS